MGHRPSGSAVPAAASDAGPAAVDGVLARLVNKIDFEQVLGVAPCSRSAHFAVHHVNRKPFMPVWSDRRSGEAKLSTGDAPVVTRPVDDLPDRHWLGTVVPKRHARRSVTRSLFKRQIRAALASHASELPPGLWLVRLRAAFPVAQYPSAASAALRAAVRAELDQLLAKARR
jgi:ribonuclease P protein component